MVVSDASFSHLEGSVSCFFFVLSLSHDGLGPPTPWARKTGEKRRGLLEESAQAWHCLSSGSPLGLVSGGGTRSPASLLSCFGRQNRVLPARSLVRIDLHKPGAQMERNTSHEQAAKGGTMLHTSRVSLLLRTVYSPSETSRGSAFSFESLRSLH